MDTSPVRPKKTTAEDNVKFLLTCMKHSPGIKPDLTKVAAELNLPSKGAADKRLFRLRKANDADGDGESGLTPKKHINANKRPLNEDEEDGGEGEHQFPAPTKKKRTKASPSKVKQAKGDGIDLGIKVEADA